MIRRFVGWLSAWPAYRWVCLMLAGYFAVALAGTWVNYLELHFNTMGTLDLSIGQQSLSSTIHSNSPYPFYEATNCGRNDRCSFLLVHPVFVAYLVTLPYALAPSPFTLFAIQDAALALAALPLFAVALIVTRSSRLSLVVAGVYLVWLPAFTGIFSFHWEAFLPLEIFGIFWLWLTHRYLAAIPVVILAYATLEIVPILLFFVAIYFLLPWLSPTVRLIRRQLRLFWQRQVTFRGGFATSLARVRRALSELPALRASLLLLVGSAVAYVSLHEFVTHGGWILGLPPLPAKYNLPLTRPVYAATFTLSNLETAWEAKLVYWLVLYATLAMVPLLAPRTLVLSVPWIVFSLFATSGYYRMGDQYAFISASVLMIGFVYGIARLQRWVDGPHDWRERHRSQRGRAAAEEKATQEQLLAELRSLDASRAWVEESRPKAVIPGEKTPAQPATAAAPPAAPSPSDLEDLRRRRKRRARWVVGVVLVGILTFNLFLNPFNPYAAPLKNDRPFVPQAALGLSWGVNSSGYNQVEKLISIMGKDPIVAVSPYLFSLVANDPYAYPMSAGFDVYNLPFNVSAGTRYVLLLERNGATVPSFLSDTLYNPAVFGTRAWIPTTYLGGVLLFQRGYGGPAQVFGTPPVFAGGTYTSAFGLVPERAGVVAPTGGTVSSSVIVTQLVPKHPNEHEVGPVFTGPELSLPWGSYQVTVVLSGSQTAKSTQAVGSESVVTIRATAFSDSIAVYPLNLSWFSTGGWTSLTFNVTLPSPVFNFAITGSNLREWFSFEVDYVTIVPISGP